MEAGPVFRFMLSGPRSLGRASSGRTRPFDRDPMIGGRSERQRWRVCSHSPASIVAKHLSIQGTGRSTHGVALGQIAMVSRSGPGSDQPAARLTRPHLLEMAASDPGKRKARAEPGLKSTPKEEGWRRQLHPSPHTDAVQHAGTVNILIA